MFLEKGKRLLIAKDAKDGHEERPQRVQRKAFNR
jgi:hypothetical protein